MSFALLFWVLMLLWLIFGIWANFPLDPNKSKILGGHIGLFILLLLLGWKVFGPAVHS